MFLICQKIQAWFRERNPFEGGPELTSLSTGICNGGTFNCENNDNVGKEIQEQRDNVYFHNSTIKRRLKVRNIESLIIQRKSVTKTSHCQAYCFIPSIDCNCSETKNNMGGFFSYELTTFPMSLFKDGLMQKPKKASLRNTLVTKKVDIDPNSLHALYRGALCINYDGVRASLWRRL